MRFEAYSMVAKGVYVLCIASVLTAGALSTLAVAADDRFAAPICFLSVTCWDLRHHNDHSYMMWRCAFLDTFPGVDLGVKSCVDMAANHTEAFA